MPAWDVLYRCNVTWSLLGQNCINSFFFRTKAAATYASIPDEMNDLMNNINNDIINPLRGVMSSNVLLVAAVLVNLNGGVFYEVVRDYVGVTGAVVSDSAPSFVAMVISWRTRFRGRRVHGRTYVPGVPMSYISGNELTTAGHAALNGAAGTILDNFAEDSRFSYPWLACFSRKNGTTIDPGPPPAVVYSSLAGVPVVRFIADTTLYTQRHRLAGRGI
jgi:hypothetical protein